ncbi:putative LRAT-like domain, papain-like cysteine peptidase superfamily [Helianthus annuus]|nr:putative LRAT-like domain, papain-like cysteine peptidase superfamily [Helianthus annuus]
MDLFSQEIERSELKKGDHVYVWRMVLLYNHHGIYIGDGKIIHFVDPRMDGSGLFSSSSSSSLTRCRMSYCGTEKVAGSGVRML